MKWCLLHAVETINVVQVLKLSRFNFSCVSSFTSRTSFSSYRSFVPHYQQCWKKDVFSKLNPQGGNSCIFLVHTTVSFPIVSPGVYGSSCRKCLSSPSIKGKGRFLGCPIWSPCLIALTARATRWGFELYSLIRIFSCQWNLEEYSRVMFSGFRYTIIS